MNIKNDNKVKILKENGSFNRNASSVTSPLFQSNPYFDAKDLIQVKYEMLRAVKNNELSISEASRQFGFSRTAYYKVEKHFMETGVDGLCLHKTGPKSPAKVTGDVLNFASDLKTKHPDITNDEIIREIQMQKGVTIHKRSLQRERAKKKRF